MFAATWAKRQFDSKHKKINLEEGDLVYLRLHRGYNLSGLKNPKLSNQHAGPFKILKKIDKLAYRLEIPRTMQIHPVISIAHLEPCPNPKADPYHRPRPTNPPPIMEEPGEWQQFKVEKVLKSRQRRYRRGKTMTEYLIRWKGYGPQHDEWYGEDLLEGCLETLIDFESAKGNAEAVDRLQTRLAALDLEPEAEPQQSSDTKERSLATAASTANTTSKLDMAQAATNEKQSQ
ncbi:reverse partial [Lasallia pustulata]|uniref:Reverse partial n=1 Tax=Lasallia pustulata TaxID=136370 RepID=A0A1W5D0W8_9LECA|nr:reverse partial [Lasallia pustulata]